MSKRTQQTIGPATSFAQVAERTGYDAGRIKGFAMAGHSRSIDAEKVFRAVGGEAQWTTIVAQELGLSNGPAS